MDRINSLEGSLRVEAQNNRQFLPGAAGCSRWRRDAALLLRIAIALLAAAILCAIPAAAYDVPLDAEVLEYLTGQCELRGVPVALALAMIETESNYDADAVSADGSCLGLMQISKINTDWLGEELGTTDLRDARQNIEAGLYILAGYLDKYDDIHKALMCYNMGHAGAKRAWKKGYVTSKYSRKIVARMEELEAGA